MSKISGFFVLVLVLATGGRQGWAGTDSPDLKIAVLGAGVSGLTAAYTLKQQGYRNVTVYEEGKEIGGKVDPIQYLGHTIELGAVWVSHDYSIVRRIAKDMGMTFENYVTPKMIVEATGNKLPFEKYIIAKYGVGKVLSALWNFHQVERKYASEWNVGFADANPDLNKSFAVFAKENGIVPITDLFEPFFVACGYGYYAEIPALYYMKLMKMMMRVLKYDLLGRVPLIHLAGLQTVNGGFQEIWRRLGATLQVETEAKVTAIRRITGTAHPGIELTIGGETKLFDRVISSIPLPQLSQIMDVSEEERSLFQKVKSYDYWITVFHGENIPKGETLFFMNNVKRESLGRPIVMANRYLDTNVFVTFQLADRSMNSTPRSMQDQLEAELARLNGRVTEIVVQKEWDYFPHVSSEDLDKGFYQDLEDRVQGQNGFYLIGGIMNFETTEHTAEYAKDLVEKKFH